MDSKPLSTRLCFLLILFCGIAVYSNTFTGSFQFDDFRVIQGNSALYPLNLGKLWHYHPLRFISNLSFAFNIYLAGFATWSFHILNLLTHILTSLVVFKLTLSILNTPSVKNWVPASQQKFFALAAALLFATHPVQTEAVTYIVQRATSLASLFYLAALWMYLKARLENDRHYWVVCLLMLAAMLTKEISFTLPFAILLLELSLFPFSEKETFRNKLIRWAPFAAFLLIIPLIYLTNSYLLTQSGGSMNILPNTANDISRWDYFLTQFRVERTYLRLLFFPAGQRLVYDYHLSRGWGDPDTWAAFSLLFSIFILAIALFKKNRLLSFGILWFFLTLSVESSVIPLHDLIFEHRLYLPMFGFALFLTSLVWMLSRSVKLFAAISLFIIITFSSMAYSRNEVWKSMVTLWQDAAKKSPRMGTVFAGLGDAYSHEMRDDKTAVTYYEKALEQGFVTPLVCVALADAYSRLGDHEKSLHYQQLISFLPASMFEQDISLYDNHALALIREGKNPEAVEMLKKDIQAHPEKSSLYLQLGEVFHQMHREEDAILSFRKAIEVAPLDNAGYNALALFYKENGEEQKALSVMVEYLKCKKKHKPLFGD